jgi:hypothetical protein
MKQSLLIGLFITMAFHSVAFADTITHRCDADTFDKEHNWGYKLKVHCCNPKVTSCTSKDAIITESPGKVSVGGNKSHNFKVQCNGNWYKVNNTSFGHSGGSIAGTANGGANNGIAGQYTLLVHNSASKGGHAWINGFDCE